MKKMIDPSKIKILICCHKECELPPNPDGIFLPIQVGAALSDKDLHMQRDDQVNGQSCDNISAKNKNYCELTAMYWAWKNIKKIYPDLEYIGLNHYRRYFCFIKKQLTDDCIVLPIEQINRYQLNKNKISKILSKRNIVLSKRKNYPYGLDIDYSVWHNSEDLRILRTVIHELTPEYDFSFDRVIINNNKFSPFNMFIMDFESFNSYCDWLFKILSECEKRIDISHYTAVQARVFGYMAERLLNVWSYNQQKDKKYLTVCKFANERNFLLKEMVRIIRNSISFRLLKPSIIIALKDFKKKKIGNTKVEISY